ncbi:sensor histidine kinase [Maridesulfovibrio hydrothermalis]|uniref:histidine kinase n=1 Tax=Maridesulfovibrio hydrothermalis AM13 = DSM 14728 TaxID=1121451 RepID=L0R8Q3_9BACT|nr:HAMP domain-containing sensor histidine kinase [Maridesulfovibrio hydrothermalis]CCO23148.1 Histidine kinase [Maridesulfovibrio hydrothermalis AM13 = DSM 14728]
MDRLPTLKKFGEQLDLFKQLIKEGREEQAASLGQTVFENYVFARDQFLRQEDELIAVRNALTETKDRAEKIEHRLKESLSAYNSDFQLFHKFANAQNHVNTFKSVADLPDVLEKISEELGVSKIAIVLDRDLCAGIPCVEVPTFFIKGIMRYIDATLSNKTNRVYIGPIARMMRPDIFFGDPEMGPEYGGSCFSFGLMNKYNAGEMIGMISFYDPSVTRFHPEMGTDFLEHFCNSVASTLIDVINHQRADLLRLDVERITRHDLKTPLNAVINLPHLLLSSEEDDSKVEMLKAIQDAGYKMLGLINRSYDIYRMESGTYVLDPGKVDLVRLLGRIRMDLLNVVEHKKSDLRIFINGRESSDGGLFIVKGEELLLFSMLANLVKNAFEATPKGEDISVYLSDSDGDKISIHNHGAVPESIRGSFFDKYSTEGKAGGSGLGTYSASLIAHAHDGEISMDSSAENGTTVTVLLNTREKD